MSWGRLASVAAALAAAAGSAGCTSGTSCIVDDVLTDRIGQADVEDCGWMPSTSAMEALDGAQNCALAAAGTQTPFRVELERQGFDSRIAVAYIGLVEGGEWKTYELSYDGPVGDGDGRQITTTYGCTGISEITPCSDSELRATLCLRCDDGPVVDICDGTSGGGGGGGGGGW